MRGSKMDHLQRSFQKIYFPLAEAILVWTFLLELVCGTQYFIVRPMDTDVIRGSSTQLNCSVGQREGRVQWSMDGFVLGYDPSIPGYDRYSIVQTSPEVFDLHIVNASLQDDADFECQVSPTGNNPSLRASAHLTILVPPEQPTILDHPNGSTVNLSYRLSMFQLTCRAQNARPAANITWYKNGQRVYDGTEYSVEDIPGSKLQNAQNVLTLTPDFRSKEHGAIYTCKATNDAIKGRFLRSEVTINVLYPPSVPEITGYSRGQVLHANDTLNMECVSRGGNPLAQVFWFKNDVKFDYSYSSSQDTQSSTNSLAIVVTPEDNGAVYRCEASNDANPDPLTANVQLVVYYPPTSVTISGNRLAKAGEVVELVCTTAPSNPHADITWYAGTRPVPSTNLSVSAAPSGGEVVVARLKVTLSYAEDNVEYKCMAQHNRWSQSVSATVTLSVLYPPSVPEISGYSEGDFMKQGDTRTLSCRSRGGNPTPTVKWFKGNSLLSGATVSTRGDTIKSEVTLTVTPADNNAIYKCTAENEATAEPLTKHIKLTVYFRPAGVTINAEPSEAKAGERLRLTCLSQSSNPPARIEWFRNNQKVDGGVDIDKQLSDNGGMTTKNVLDIVPTYRDNQAEFHCRARNEVTNEMINDAITIQVLYAPVFDYTSIPPVIVIVEGQGQVINMTASANPTDVNYQFYKQGAEVDINSLPSFSLSAGVLTVGKAKRQDSGQYHVVATNTQGSGTFNFTFNVQYPATITSSFSSPVYADVDGEAHFVCVADANPMIERMITWSRQDFDMTGARITYANGQGNLTVSNLKREDTGKFTCTADNRIGEPNKKDAMLIVKFAPEIDKEPHFSKAAGEDGSTVQLTCRANGAPKVTFTWTKNEASVTGSRVSITPKEIDVTTYESVLTLRDISKENYGTYYCAATNDKGTDFLAITVDGTSVPDAPYDLAMVNVTHDSITISWRPGFNGGHPQQFQIQYKAKTGGGQTYIDVTPIDTKQTTVYTIRGLNRGTDYIISIHTSNKLGVATGPIPEISIKTADTAPSTHTSPVQSADDTPVIVILVVCVVGIFLLALNVGLILFFVRRRKKRLESNSDSTSHTNTMELYGPPKESTLYPITPSDESHSYGTYEKNMDDFSDDYKNFEHEMLHNDLQSSQGSTVTCDKCVNVKVKTISRPHCSCLSQDSSGDEDIKRVFLPPPAYTYVPNKLDSPQLSSTHKTFLTGSRTYLDDPEKPYYRYEDPYGRRNKGTFDPDYMNHSHAGSNSRLLYDYDAQDTHLKSPTDFSDQRSSRSSSRNGGHPHVTPPPPPPVRSTSKGMVERGFTSPVPPIPSRNYDLEDLREGSPQRYTASPDPSYSASPNVISNPHFEGPYENHVPNGPYINHQPNNHPVDDMRGDLV